MPISSNYSRSSTIDTLSPSSSNAKGSGEGVGFQAILDAGQNPDSQVGPQGIQGAQGDATPKKGGGSNTNSKGGLGAKSEGSSTSVTAQEIIASMIGQPTAMITPKPPSGASGSSTSQTLAMSRVSPPLVGAVGADGPGVGVGSQERVIGPIPAIAQELPSYSPSESTTVQGGTQVLDASASLTEPSATAVAQRSSELGQSGTTQSLPKGQSASTQVTSAASSPTTTLSNIGDLLAPSSPSTPLRPEAASLPLPTSSIETQIATASPPLEVALGAAPIAVIDVTQKVPSPSSSSQLESEARVASSVPQSRGANQVAPSTTQVKSHVFDGANSLLQSLQASELASSPAVTSSSNAPTQTPSATTVMLTFDPNSDQMVLANVVSSHISTNPDLPSTLHLRMNPEGLGTVDMVIASTQNGLHLAIASSSQSLHQYLNAGVDGLRQHLSDSLGVTVTLDLRQEGQGSPQGGSQGGASLPSTTAMLNSGFWGATSSNASPTPPVPKVPTDRLIDLIA